MKRALDEWLAGLMLGCVIAALTYWGLATAPLYN